MVTHHPRPVLFGLSLLTLLTATAWANLPVGPRQAGAPATAPFATKCPAPITPAAFQEDLQTTVCQTGDAQPFYREDLRLPMAKALPEVKAILARNHFDVVFSMNVLHRIEARQATLKIPDFNLGKYDAIVSLSVCNPYDFSHLLSADWQSTTLCPRTVTLVGKGDYTRISYARRAVEAVHTPAYSAARAIDQQLISALGQIPGAIHPSVVKPAR
ncbi:hypothetical protein [Thiomonas sp.]